MAADYGRHGNSILNNEQHLFTRVKKLEKLWNLGVIEYLIRVSQGWSNENLYNTPLPEDRCVSRVGDTGVLTLPEPTRRNRDLGK